LHDPQSNRLGGTNVGISKNRQATTMPVIGGFLTAIELFQS